MGKTLVSMYVNDIRATGTSAEKVDDFFSDMQAVELESLGVITKCLGIVFKCSEETGWTIDQENIIEEMVDNMG